TRVIGTLSAVSIAALGIRAGEASSPEMSERIQLRMSFERACKTAADALARRPLTSAELRDRLARRGFDTSIIDETLGALRREGLVDDTQVARETIRHAVNRGGAGAPLLESKLAAKGVDAETTRRVLDEELPQLASNAMDAARRRLRALP